jgi:hypothetical protein
MGLCFQAAVLITVWHLAMRVEAQTLGEVALTSALKSECGQHVWKQRGKAPAGFIKGMAASYAKTWCEAAKTPDSVAAKVAGTGFKSERDALALYDRDGGSQDDRLRAIYALAISEGMRESSGNTTEGYDSTVKNQTADIAEAGLFQVSHDSLRASPLLQELWDRFAASPGSCNLSIFEEGIRKVNRPVVGSGKGAEFQRFTRACPAFAVEYAAVMMRTNLNHFGPIKRKEAELLPACIDMFERVEQAAKPLCP